MYEDREGSLWIGTLSGGMVRMRDSRFTTYTRAGMPSMLLYRTATAQIEEIPLKGMPLGSLSKYTYTQQEFALTPGDVLLMMTDGFAERFNESGEILGEDVAWKVLADSAGKSPQEIINHLIDIGDEWGNNRPQDDDLTFVVIKLATPAT